MTRNLAPKRPQYKGVAEDLLFQLSQHRRLRFGLGPDPRGSGPPVYLFEIQRGTPGTFRPAYRFFWPRRIAVTIAREILRRDGTLGTSGVGP